MHDLQIKLHPAPPLLRIGGGGGLGGSTGHISCYKSLDNDMKLSGGACSSSSSSSSSREPAFVIKTILLEVERQQVHCWFYDIV